MRTNLLAAAGLFAIAALAFSALGCSDDAYCFTCGTSLVEASAEAGDEKVGTDTGGFYLDGSGGSASDAKEAGDSSDGCSGDLQTDPKNCGACGVVCELLGAFPKCVAGKCAIDTCAPGHYDLNGIGDDGCEYSCTPTQSGIEECNGKDDNCDGKTDEGFDIKTDPKNCGVCGNLCTLPHATAGCAEVSGIVRCVISACEAGFADTDKVASDGCEYACPVNPPIAELCNDKDDDCDGVVNNGNPEGGGSCDDTCPVGGCKGECKPGAFTCVGSSLVCMGGTGPALELCDTLDNDCDGVADNGFDLQVDPLNCGSCGHECTLEHAIGGCSGGACVIDVCLPGFSNADGDNSNGCEYSCPVYPTTLETCNGKDDDCNGTVDDPTMIAQEKPAAALCLPKPGTPCENADFACLGTLGWRCAYGAGAEVDTNGKLVQVEALCDGIDGNCNGQVDESYPEANTACDNGKIGACRDAGMKVCNQTKDGTFCDLSVLPDPVPGAPSTEVCNGIDDDCNGQVDDGVVDDMVHVTWGVTSFWVDRWEASHPDATATDRGSSTIRSCTRAGVLPWTLVTQSAAAAACASRGARLCSAAELQAACEGAAVQTYPYGSTYAPQTCNGLDFDGIPGGTDDDVLIPTGSSLLSACVTVEGIHDLSGNATEWTSSSTGNTGPPNNTPIYQVRGGSYESLSTGMTCQFSLSRYAASALLPDLGFRCCKD